MIESLTVFCEAIWVLIKTRKDLYHLYHLMTNDWLFWIIKVNSLHINKSFGLSVTNVQSEILESFFGHMFVDIDLWAIGSNSSALQKFVKGQKLLLAMSGCRAGLTDRTTNQTQHIQTLHNRKNTHTIMHQALLQQVIPEPDPSTTHLSVTDVIIHTTPGLQSVHTDLHPLLSH